MRRSTLGIATMLAMTVGVGGQIERPPLAPDEKPARRQQSPLYGYYGIPFPHLKHVSRETLNRAADDIAWPDVIRAKRRARRKSRMRLRKLRGWR